MKNILSTSIICLFISPMAWSQEAPEALDEESVKMQPLRIEDDENITTRVESDELEQKQVEDLEDVFRKSTDVRVGGARKNSEKIYVRGIEDRNLNVVVDGSRQSGYLFHHQGRVNVDPEMMKQIEVEAGTGNALSGPGALGGSIRFITKDPEDLLQPNQKYGVLLKAGYTTNSDEQSGTIAGFTKPLDWFSALAYVKSSKSNDSRDGDGNSIRYTGAKPQSGLAKFVLTPNQNHKIVFSANQREDNGERQVRSNFGYSATQPITDQKFTFSSLGILYDYTSGSPLFNVHLELSDALQRFESRTSTAGAARSRNLGASIRNRLDYKNIRWYVGTDFYQETAEGTNSTRTTGEERGIINGLFTQATWTPISSWRLTGGARSDSYKLSSMGGTEFNDTGVSPNASTRYQISENFATSLGWAKAFKGSTPIEIMMLSGTKSAATRTENLSATTAETTELGFEYKQKNTNVNLTLFTTLIQNPQISDVTAGVITRTNAPDIRSQGWTLGYTQGLSEKWIGSIGYTHTMIRANDLAVGSASGGTHTASGAGDRLNATFDYRLSEENIVATWSSLWVSEFSDVPTGATKQPGYDVHEISLSWLPATSVRLNAGVYNIFNKKYVEQGSVYQVNSPLYEPGTDVRFSASYTF